MCPSTQWVMNTTDEFKFEDVLSSTIFLHNTTNAHPITWDRVPGFLFIFHHMITLASNPYSPSLVRLQIFYILTKFLLLLRETTLSVYDSKMLSSTAYLTTPPHFFCSMNEFVRPTPGQEMQRIIRLVPLW